MSVYLALYRGRKEIHTPFDILARLSDWLTRKLTRGQYSHCEIAMETGNAQYCCYSSSVRDGGVRCKIMPLPSDKWDLIPLGNTTEMSAFALFELTKGQQYDWFGALGIVLPLSNSCKKWFCSEWCARAIGISDPWRFSPNTLAAVARSVGTANRK